MHPMLAPPQAAVCAIPRTTHAGRGRQHATRLLVRAARKPPDQHRYNQQQKHSQNGPAACDRLPGFSAVPSICTYKTGIGSPTGMGRSNCSALWICCCSRWAISPPIVSAVRSTDLVVTSTPVRTFSCSRPDRREPAGPPEPAEPACGHPGREFGPLNVQFDIDRKLAGLTAWA